MSPSPSPPCPPVPVHGHSAPPARAPQLTFELEPWGRVFLRNFADWLFGRDARAIPRGAALGTFWNDVFVTQVVPKRRFAQSAVLHGGLAALVYLAITLPGPSLTQSSAFRRATIQYYSVSEYLPELKPAAAPVRA